MFQPIHTTTNTVIHAMNVAVPRKRAVDSANRPKRSGSGSRRERNERRTERGWSRRARSAMRDHLRASPGIRLSVVLFSPALRQQVVEHVVDGHRPEQVEVLVDD